MSHIPGDLPDEAEPFFTDDIECKCELCGTPCTLHGDNNYCDPCEARVDAEEEAEVAAQMDVYMGELEWEPIPRITVRPVDGPSFAELRRILDKVQP